MNFVIGNNNVELIIKVSIYLFSFWSVILFKKVSIRNNIYLDWYSWCRNRCFGTWASRAWMSVVHRNTFRSVIQKKSAILSTLFRLLNWNWKLVTTNFVNWITRSMMWTKVFVSTKLLIYWISALGKVTIFWVGIFG